MRFLVIAGLLLVAVASSKAFVCPPNFCDTVRCKSAGPCSEGRVAVKGGTCGCCDVCVAQIAEGGNCAMTLLLGQERRHECKEGLTCDRRRTVCVRDPLAGPCHKKLLEMRDVDEGRFRVGRFNPRCDDTGYYQHQQCQGSVCFCVNKQGEQIHGFEVNIGQSLDQNCQCARDQAEYRQTGMLGKMFHCEANGNYSKVQCMGSVCYCANTSGNMLEGQESVHISKMNELKC